MIIGLCGYAGSGKNTVADILVQEFGFKQYAFADKLRDLAYEINPLVCVHRVNYRLAELVDAYGWDKVKREVPGVREFLQDLGVWHRENCGEDFWVGLVAKQIGGLHENVVITDVRFPNEARWVRSLFGQLWRIQRPGVGPVNGHISEQLDLAADATIWNGSSIANLMLKVHELVREEQAA